MAVEHLTMMFDDLNMTTVVHLEDCTSRFLVIDYGNFVFIFYHLSIVTGESLKVK